MGRPELRDEEKRESVERRLADLMARAALRVAAKKKACDLIANQPKKEVPDVG